MINKPVSKELDTDVRECSYAVDGPCLNNLAHRPEVSNTAKAQSVGRGVLAMMLYVCRGVAAMKKWYPNSP